MSAGSQSVLCASPADAMISSSHRRPARLFHLYDECEAANPPPMLKNARFGFEVDAVAEGEGTRFLVRETGSSELRAYELEGGEQEDYAAFFARLAQDFGTRLPHILAADRSAAPESAVP